MFFFFFLFFLSNWEFLSGIGKNKLFGIGIGNWAEFRIWTPKSGDPEP